MTIMFLASALFVLAAPQGNPKPFTGWPTSQKVPSLPAEKHIRNIRQLTFGGQNAEAYWSADGKKICFQSTQPGFPDEQIFTMNSDGSNKRLISTGLGRTTCSYFSPDGKYLYFSSTHLKEKGPQPRPDMSQGYVWMVNPNFALFKARADGTNIRPIIQRNGYVAETTIAPNGSFLTFTGGFDGDLEIYRAKLDGTGVKRLTNEVGYDGGPFVSWDSKKIVYRRAPKFANDAEKQDYLRLFKQNMVRPTRMDIWMMNADGTRKKQVTDLGKASFAPFMHPDGKHIIFGSNHDDPKGREFDLYMVNSTTGAVEQITFSPDFDGFPMFSRDGKKLLWASNRHGKVEGETNIFVADWVK